MGSVIGYDALCKRQDFNVSHDVSRHSTPEHIHKKIEHGKQNIFFETLLFFLKKLLFLFQTIVLQWLV